MSNPEKQSVGVFDPELYLRTVKRSRRVIEALWGLNIIGIENVPQEGAVIVDMSHRSYLDPWVIGVATPRPLRGMAKEELLNWYYFGLGNKYFANRGFIFISRETASRQLRTYEQSLEILRAKEALAVAEEGTHKNKGPKLGRAEAGVARLAVKMEAEGVPCSVVPVGMSTEDMHKKPRKTINVVYGKPLRVEDPGNTIKSRKDAAKIFGKLVHSKLQEVFTQALEN